MRRYLQVSKTILAADLCSHSLSRIRSLLKVVVVKDYYFFEAFLRFFDGFFTWHKHF